MTNDQREIHRKKRVIEYAEKTGNTDKTCRYFGLARSTFFLCRARYREFGDDGLKSRRRGPTGVPERVLQRMLGHRDAASTRRYAMLGDDALVYALRPKEASPGGGGLSPGRFRRINIEGFQRSNGGGGGNREPASLAKRLASKARPRTLRRFDRIVLVACTYTYPRRSARRVQSHRSPSVPASDFASSSAPFRHR